MRNSLIFAGALIFASAPAWAGEPCRSAKDLVNMAQTFYGDQPELTNVISPKVTLTMKGINGYPNPSHLLYRNGDEEHRLAVEDGLLTGFEAAADWSKDGELCRLVDGKLDVPADKDSVEVSMSFSFPYQRTDGRFSIAEIREGAKDGSKVMNGLAPGGLGFAVPGLKAIVLRPAEGSKTAPTVVFTRKGEPVDVPISHLGVSQMVRIKDIKASKADALHITEAYRLEATFKFDPEKIAQAEAKRLKAEQARSN